MENLCLKGALGMYTVLPQALHGGGALLVSYRHNFLVFIFSSFVVVLQYAIAHKDMPSVPLTRHR